MRSDVRKTAVLARASVIAAWILPSFVILFLLPPMTAFPFLIWSSLIVLPIGLFRMGLVRVTVAASWPVLPLTIYWVGYASLNGVGPSPDDFTTVFAATADEASGAIDAAVTAGSLFGVVGHIAFLAAATGFCLRRRSPAERGGRWPSLVGGLAVAGALLAAGPAHRLGSPIAFLAGVARLVATDGLGTSPSAIQRAAPPDLPAPERKTVAIFAVGETGRFDALSPARRNRDPWTGSLVDRAAAGLAAWLPPVCAGADNTNASVPLLVTGTRPDVRDAAPATPTGLMRLAAAGYRTGWFSNNSLDAAAFGHRDGAQVRFDPPGRGRLDDWALDEVLLEPLERFVRQEGSVAAVLHFQGQHHPYARRYPAALFPDAASWPGNDERHYERASIYTAKVIADLIGVLDRLVDPAFVIYTSDHGENLPSDGNGLRLHMSARTSRPAILVPGFVAWNEAFRRQHEPMVALAPLVRAPLLAHADLFDLWMALAGTGPAPAATPDPKVWGNLAFGEAKRALSCSSLPP